MTRRVSYVADDQTSERLATGMWRLSQRRMIPWFIGTLALALVVGFTTLSSLPKQLTFVILMFVSLGVGFLLGRRLTLRRYRRIFATWAGPGCRIETEFSDDRMALVHRTADTRFSYEAFEKVQVDDRVVFFKQLDQRLYLALPIEVVPTDELTKIKAAITS